MRDVSLISHKNGEKYGQIIATYLTNPLNIENNKALRELEAALELSI